MERIIPDLQNHPIRILIPGEETVNKENYIKCIEALERRYEKSLIDTFARVGVHASVKTDKYSLPYKHFRNKRMESCCNNEALRLEQSKIK